MLVGRAVIPAAAACRSLALASVSNASAMLGPAGLTGVRMFIGAAGRGLAAAIIGCAVMSAFVLGALMFPVTLSVGTDDVKATRDRAKSSALNGAENWAHRNSEMSAVQRRR